MHNDADMVPMIPMVPMVPIQSWTAPNQHAKPDLKSDFVPARPWVNFYTALQIVTWSSSRGYPSKSGEQVNTSLDPFGVSEAFMYDFDRLHDRRTKSPGPEVFTN